MYPMLIAMLGAMLMTWHVAITAPAEVELQRQATADAMAVNFWTYRRGVLNYMEDHPADRGEIDAATLLDSYLKPMGYVAKSEWVWGHWIDANGIPYAFSKDVVSPAGVDAIFVRGGKTLRVGTIKSDNTMTSVQPARPKNNAPLVVTTGIPLPTNVTSLAKVGSIVVIGK